MILRRGRWKCWLINSMASGSTLPTTWSSMRTAGSTSPIRSFAPQPLPQEIQAVYYRAADGTVSRVTGNIAAPNGVALSPDGKRLYVIPTQQAEMLVYEVTGPGKIGPAEVFCTLRQPQGRTGTGGDGMVVDEQGNLYITSNLGVQIFSAEGQYRGRVQTPEQPANVTFGGPEFKTLYITARTGLYRAEMPIAGLKPN